MGGVSGYSISGILSGTLSGESRGERKARRSDLKGEE